MENNDILIQCDEVTKSIMEELQDEMVNSLTKITKEMQNELLQSMKPIEKKINDLKEDLSDENEDTIEKIDDLNKSISKMTSSIENILADCLNNVMSKEDNVLNDRLNKLMSECSIIKQGVKINNDNTVAVNNKIDELQKSVKGSFFDNKMLLNEKIGSIKSIIDEKNLLVETVNNFEKTHDKKLDTILEELEYSNKSFFYKLFNKRTKE